MRYHLQYVETFCLRAMKNCATEAIWNVSFTWKIVMYLVWQFVHCCFNFIISKARIKTFSWEFARTWCNMILLFFSQKNVMILLFFLYSANIWNMTLLLFVESILMYSPFCSSCKHKNLLSFSRNKIKWFFYQNNKGRKKTFTGEFGRTWCNMILLFFLYSVNICNMTLLLFVQGFQ